jgi:hypothetical protein
MNTQKFLYAPALLTALALMATFECLVLGAEGLTEHLARRATVFRETQKIKGGPVMAEYQIAVSNGEMALATVIINATACAQWQDRDDDYLNIYWRDGRGFEWKPGASQGICYPCDETQMENYLVFWINRGGLYNYPLRYFPASQPDGTYNLNLPDSDPLKEDYPNVKVTVVGGKVWVSEATLMSRRMPNQPIVFTRALPDVIDDFQIPPLPNSIQFKPAKNPLAQRMRYHD